jgi:hypothetical protein
VSPSGDDVRGMSATWLLDDDTIDALVQGDDLPPQHRDLAAFAARVRAAGEGAPPPPSEALAAVLAGGLGADAAGHRASAPAAGRRASRLAKVAGLGVAVKLTLGASAAAAGVLGAGAAGVLPGAADDTVRNAIEAVTPLEFSESEADEPPGGPGRGNAPAAPGAGGGGDGTTGEPGDAGDQWPGEGHDGPTRADQSERGVAEGAPDGSPPDDGSLPDEAEQRRTDPPAPPAPPGAASGGGAPATTPTTAPRAGTTAAGGDREPAPAPATSPDLSGRD